MKYLHSKSTGSSMSELLFTLAIIGAIFSLVVFGFFLKYNNIQNLTALRKAYSIINQVAVRVVNQDDSPMYLDLNSYSYDSSALAYLYFRPHFRVLRECSSKKGCWKYPTKFLSGKVYMARSQPYFYMFTLLDGMNIIMSVMPKEIVLEEFGVNVQKDSLIFIVDVNGDRFPNQMGRDIFSFVLKDDRIVPAGFDSTYNCNKVSSGLSCTARVIGDNWRITYY